MKRARLLLSAILLAMALLPCAFVTAVHAESGRLALFAVEFVPPSLEPASETEIARLDLVERVLGEALAEQGLEIVPVEAVGEEVGRYAYLHECRGCEVAMAKELGADLAAVAWVTKISNLILHISMSIRDVSDGTIVRGGSVDIRGNNDESWSRGARYLVQKRLYKP